MYVWEIIFTFLLISTYYSYANNYWNKFLISSASHHSTVYLSRSPWHFHNPKRTRPFENLTNLSRTRPLIYHLSVPRRLTSCPYNLWPHLRSSEISFFNVTRSLVPAIPSQPWSNGPHINGRLRWAVGAGLVEPCIIKYSRRDYSSGAMVKRGFYRSILVFFLVKIE